MLLRDFTDPFAGHSGIYHFSMPHLEKTLLFENDRDYTVGVNYLAIVTLSNPVSLLCYCLMSNHFHLLLAGRLEDCVKLYSSYIIKLCRYIAKERGDTGILHKNTMDIQAVVSEKQFQNEVLYILRNPYKARICSPFSYPWSSINTYVQLPPKEILRNNTIDSALTISSQAKTANDLTFTTNDLTLRAYRKMFKVRGKLEGLPIVNGIIPNSVFVDYKYVENRIGSSLGFFDTMRLYDLESTVESMHGIEERITYSDSELKSKVSLICKKEIYVNDIALLSRKDLLLLARILARRYGIKKKQIARQTGLSTDVLDTLL